MAEHNSTQREQKKAIMRSNMLEGKGKKYSIRIPAVVIEYKNYIAAAILIFAAAIAVIGAGLKLYGNFHTYSTYEVDWSVEISNPSTVDCVGFADGVLTVGKDGMAFYNDKGIEEWAVPYEMKSPVTVTEGNYVLVYDWKGQTMTVCNQKGFVGNMNTSYPISRADISAGGVTAAVLEDTRMSYISYYRSSGEKLGVNIQSPFATGGYPLDISISPNGQQLAVSYYYVGGGSGACRVDFYDFEKGKEQPDRIVGTFSYKESDTYIPMVVYINNSTAFAVGDNQIVFYSTGVRTNIRETVVPVYGEIRKVFYNEKYLGIVVEEDDELKIRVYSMDGKQEDVIRQEAMYNEYAFDGTQVVMHSESHCRVTAFSGRERFNLGFENGIEELVPFENQKSFYLVTMDMLQKITLK